MEEIIRHGTKFDAGSIDPGQSRARFCEPPREHAIIRDGESRQSRVREIVNATDDRFRFTGWSGPIGIERLREQRAVADEEKIAVGINSTGINRQRHFPRRSAIERADPQLMAGCVLARHEDRQVEKMFSVGKKLWPPRKARRRAGEAHDNLRLPAVSVDSINTG